MPKEEMTAAYIAKNYSHQLNSDALAYAQLLVQGCTTFFKTPEAGVNYILSAASEFALEELGAEAENTFRAYCRALWLEDTALEKRWTERTTNDAIDEAFATLNQQGVVALQNVGGTVSMGWAEVQADIDKQVKKKKKVLGGTFYHAQDTERAVAGKGFRLTFGAIDDSEEGARRVANTILQALRDEGVACQWDGNEEERIFVLPFVWKKRRTTRAPARQSPVPWRSLSHADGRRWEIAGLNNRVCTRFTDSGGVSERQTPAKDLRGEIEELVAEQVADGFVETSPPAGAQL